MKCAKFRAKSKRLLLPRHYFKALVVKLINKGSFYNPPFALSEVSEGNPSRDEGSCSK